MSRIAPFALLAGIGLILSTASAGPPTADAKCMPQSVMLTGGTDDIKFSAGAQVVLNKMITEGRDQFIVFQNSGTKVFCAW